jgi:hypothetical protein
MKHCFSQKELIAFKVIYQVELANCIQRSNVYMCDKHQVLENDLEDTPMGALYLRFESGVQKHFRFERKPTKELYQIYNLNHLNYSTPPPHVYIVQECNKKKECCI